MSGESHKRKPCRLRVSSCVAGHFPNGQGLVVHNCAKDGSECDLARRDKCQMREPPSRESNALISRLREAVKGGAR